MFTTSRDYSTLYYYVKYRYHKHFTVRTQVHSYVGSYVYSDSYVCNLNTHHVDINTHVPAHTYRHTFQIAIIFFKSGLARNVCSLTTKV